MSSTLYGPLGAGRLLGETYVLLFRRFLTYLPPILLLLAAGGILSLVFGLPGAANPLLRVLSGGIEVAGLGLVATTAIFSGVLYLAIMGLVALLTIELKQRRKPAPMIHLGRALRSVPMLLVLGLAAALLVGVSILVLSLAARVFAGPNLAGFLVAVVAILGGLCLYVRLAPIVPVIVHERAALRSFRRAFELTHGYFWPILGLLIVNIVLVVLITSVIAFLIGLSLALLISEVQNTMLTFEVIAVIGQALSGIFTYLAPVILSTLIYLRLRELKEGNDEDIAAVFA